MIEVREWKIVRGVSWKERRELRKLPTHMSTQRQIGAEDTAKTALH